MQDFFEQEVGQTLIDPDERVGLIPGHIRLREELNQFEENNILQAYKKYLSGTRRRWELSNPEILKKIHQAMFGFTWKWAGRYRQSNKNLGIDWTRIPEEMKKAGDNFKYWKENNIYSPLEMAVRYHHRLVVIHAFPNGNGRHARLVADMIIREGKLPPLTWGGKKLAQKGNFRQKYIQALQIADKGNFVELLKFAVS